MKTGTGLCAALLALVSLSGCTAIFGGGHSSIASAKGESMADIYHEYAVEQLELGRQQLRAGAFASAIEPLRRASHDRQSAAAAHNAMGVAYAKLGRGEVASRFFNLAMAEEPGNAAFAANLARLGGNPAPDGPSNVEPGLAAQQANGADPQEKASAQVGDADRVSVPVADPRMAVQTISPSYGAAIRATGNIGQMQRISRHEVMVGGQVGIAAASRAEAQYPVRIPLETGKVTLREGARSGSVGYPVRIHF